MPRALEHFDFDASRSKYRWETMTDGRPWQLIRPDDFDCKPEGVRQSATKFAQRKGYTLKSKVVDDNTIVVQFTPLGNGAAKRPRTMVGVGANGYQD